MSNLKPLDDPITDPESVDSPSIAAPSAYPKQKKLKPRGRPFQPGDVEIATAAPEDRSTKRPYLVNSLSPGKSKLSSSDCSSRLKTATQSPPVFAPLASCRVSAPVTSVLNSLKSGESGECGLGGLQ
jgi:hypothetical protein